MCLEILLYIFVRYSIRSFSPLFQVVRPSNHATIQSIVKTVGIIPGIPEPCCVPEKMNPLSVLFLDEAKNIVLKNYPDMSVETCSCRQAQWNNHICGDTVICCGYNTKTKCEEAYCLLLPHTVQCTLQSYVVKGFTHSVHSFEITVFLIMRVFFFIYNDELCL